METETIAEIKPGQLWWDKDHKWSDGSDSVDIVYLTLSHDPAVTLKGEMRWKSARFMWCGKFGYCGANIREFTSEEIRLMHLVGNISQIKEFI